jgi:hypothetical protein
MQFDLQTYLSERFKEVREDISDVSKKVDKLDTKLDDHETRLVVVENARRTMRWLAGAVIVGFVTFLFDLFLTHLPATVTAFVK